MWIVQCFYIILIKGYAFYVYLHTFEYGFSESGRLNCPEWNRKYYLTRKVISMEVLRTYKVGLFDNCQAVMYIELKQEQPEGFQFEK